MGDFNLTTKNKHLEELLNLFNLRSLISSPVCFQSTSPCIYLILTNQEDLSSNSNTCEAGISDHHHLVSVMLNKKISKGITKALFYRDYKKFEQNKFAKDLTHQLQNTKNPSYNKFEKVFFAVSDNHVPLKKKQLRFNHSPFTTKALRKFVMTPSRLKNINKKRSYDNWDKYKKKRNFCVKLLCKTKQNYFSNIDIKSASHTKKLWKTIRTYFSNKGLNSNKILLSEKGRLIKDLIAIATTYMNDYFLNIKQTIGLKQFQFDHANDLLEYHTSIIKIKSNLSNVSDKFDLKNSA